MELNLFDLGVILTVGLSALLSFFRGFVREIMSLGGWLVASVVTLRFIEPATSLIKPHIKSEVIASAVAAVGLFFITLVVISILANILLKILKPGDKMGLFDNLAGLAFGAARGALIVAIGFFIMKLVFTEKNYPDLVKKAYTRPYVEHGAKAIAALTPDYLDKLTKSGKGTGGALGDAAKDSAKTMMKRVDHAKDAVEDKAEDLPSMEDLQRRIKEENEKRDVR